MLGLLIYLTGALLTFTALAGYVGSNRVRSGRPQVGYGWLVGVLLMTALWPLSWGYVIYCASKAGLDWLVFRGRSSGDDILDRLFNTEDNERGK